MTRLALIFSIVFAFALLMVGCGDYGDSEYEDGAELWDEEQGIESSSEFGNEFAEPLGGAPVSSTEELQDVMQQPEPVGYAKDDIPERDITILIGYDPFGPDPEPNGELTPEEILAIIKAMEEVINEEDDDPENEDVF